MKFTVPGAPIAKGRHRTAILKQCRKCGKKTCMRVCRCGSEEMNMLTTLESPDPDSARYENKVALFAKEALNGDGLMEGPLSIEIVAYFLIPESRACKKHIRSNGCLVVNEVTASLSPCKRIHEGDYYQSLKRNDWDNIGKSVCDGLNQIAYRDDGQIADAVVKRRYSSVPRVEIEIHSLWAPYAIQGGK